MSRFIQSAISVLFVMFGLAAPAQAYVFSIDNFSITKNNTLIFDDAFEDGNPPPSAPDFTDGDPASYFVRGALGPESGTKLSIDRDDAVPVPRPAGGTALLQGALLNTNIQTGSGRGLRLDDDLSLTGIFDYIAPSETNQFYAVRFTDRATGIGQPGNDIVSLQVRRTVSDQTVLELLKLSFVDGTVERIAEQAINDTHDQIVLTLATAANSQAVQASYSFIDSGTQSAIMTFADTVNIFNGEDWTRAQFIAGQVVPEPTTLTLMGLGLAGIGYRRKRKLAA